MIHIFVCSTPPPNSFAKLRLRTCAAFRFVRNSVSMFGSDCVGAFCAIRIGTLLIKPFLNNAWNTSSPFKKMVNLKILSQARVNCR